MLISYLGLSQHTRSVLCCVLQCVAVCCSMLQCVAVCCSVLQCVAVCCSVLLCAAVCCSVLQCVAVCCSALLISALMASKTPLLQVFSRQRILKLVESVHLQRSPIFLQKRQTPVSLPMNSTNISRISAKIALYLSRRIIHNVSL